MQYVFLYLVPDPDRGLNGKSLSKHSYFAASRDLEDILGAHTAFSLTDKQYLLFPRWCSFFIFHFENAQLAALSPASLR